MAEYVGEQAQGLRRPSAVSVCRCPLCSARSVKTSTGFPAVNREKQKQRGRQITGLKKNNTISSAQLSTPASSDFDALQATLKAKKQRGRSGSVC